MADTDYIIQILLKAKDEATAKVAALKAELDRLTGTSSAEGVAKDLDDVGRKAEEAEKKSKSLREEHVRGSQSARDLGRDIEGATSSIDRHGKSVDEAAKSHENLGHQTSDVQDAMAETAAQFDNAGDSSDNLKKKVDEIVDRFDSLGQEVKSGNRDLGDARREYGALGNSLDSLSKKFDIASNEAVKLRDLAEQARATAKSLQTLEPASRQPITISTDVQKQINSIKDLDNALQNYRSTLDQTDRSQQEQKSYIDAFAKEYRNLASSLGPAHDEFGRLIADSERLKGESLELGKGFSDTELKQKINDVTTAYDGFLSKLKAGTLTENETKRAAQDFSRTFSSLSREFDLGGDEALKWGAKAEEASKIAKKALLESTGGIISSLKRGDFGETFEAINAHLDGFKFRITGVASAVQGFKEIFTAAIPQQLVTIVGSLAGSLISVASAASEAGAAVGGAFISGIAQMIPMVSIAAAALLRFKSILQAVSIKNEAEKTAFFEPHAGKIKELQNQSTLISANQQLINSNIQLNDAQLQVRDSQIALTEAREQALKNITDLVFAEKSARLAAEGASISLAEARRQEQIAVESGSTTGIITAEEQVKSAELAKKKADWEVPWARREADIARRRGVEGARSVVSAHQSLISSHQAVTQAEQAHEAAARQRQITLLQASQPSSSETSQEAQYQQLLSQMSGPEKALVKVLDNLDKQLKSPNSPLKKITDYFVEPFAEAAERLQELLGSESFLGPVDNLAQKMGSSLKRFKNEIFGEKGTSFFEEMSKDASENLPIVTSSIIHLMNLFQDIAKAADPAFKKMSEDWDNFWNKLDSKYSTPKGIEGLEKFFNKAVKYAEGFAHLGSATGSFLMAIGHDAAPQGLQTVSTFSQSIEKATKWIESHGPQVTKFFREAREGLSLIGGTLLDVGKELIEVFNLSSLATFSTFLKVMLIPGLGNVVKLIGFLTKIVLGFINLFGAPGRIILEGFGTVLASIFVTAKVLKYRSAIALTFKAFKGLYGAMKTFAATKDIGAAWETLKNTIFGARKEIEDTKVAQEALNDERLVTDETSAGRVILPSGVSSAESSEAESSTGSDLLAGAEGGGAAAGIAGLLSRFGGGLSAFKSAAAEMFLPALAASGELYAFSKITPPHTLGGEGNDLLTEALHASPFGTTQSAGMPEGNEQLLLFNQELRAARQNLNNLPASKIEELSHKALELSKNSELKKNSKELQQWAKELNPATIAATSFAESVRKQFEKLSPAAKRVSESFSSIKESTEFIFRQVKEKVKTNIESIAEDLGTHSKRGKEALVENFASAREAIYESMRRGTVTTKRGMEEIQKLVSEALSKYGISNTQINRHTSGVGSNPTRAEEYEGRATGGWISAARGGKTYNVAEGGSDEMVLTTDPRHASRQASLLGEYLSKAPAVRSMAEGGTVSALKAFQASFSGTHMDRALAAMSFVSSMKLPYVWGGGHTEPATIGDGMDCSGSVDYVVQQAGYKVPTTVSGGIGSWGFPAGPGLITIFFNDDHTFMRAGDRYWGTSGFARQKDNGGPGWFESSPSESYLAGFNTAHLPDVEGTKTWISAAKILENHGQQLTDLGKGRTASSFVGAVQDLAGKTSGNMKLLQQIISPKVKGGGLVGKVVQGALNKVTSAANEYLEGYGGAPEQSILGSLSSAGGNYNRSQLENLWDKESGPRGMARIMAAIALAESAGNSSAESPVSDEGSHAQGLWQIEMPMNSADVPGGNAKNPIANTIGAIKILASQGLDAWETYTNGMYLKYMASGGPIRRLKEFASGGRAPWGGAPVPIIAHEGERIMNPAQYHATATLAGTSPGGLDSYLGFNSSSPRQSFADGGNVPSVRSVSAQESSSSNEIKGGISRLIPSLMSLDPNERIEFTTIEKLFKAFNSAFKKINKFSRESKLYTKYIEEFVTEITDSENGLLARMQTGREKRTELSQTSNIQKTYAVKGHKVVRNLSEGQQYGLDLGTMQKEAKNMEDEVREIEQLKDETTQKISHADTMKNSKDRTILLNKLHGEYNKLIEEQNNLTKAMAENIENRYNTETQKIQSQVSLLESSYSFVSQEQSSSLSSAQTKGQYSEVQKINQQIATSANKQIQALQKPLKEAEKIGNTEEADTIKESIAGLKSTITNSVVERLNAIQSEIDQNFQVTQGALSSEQGIAQSLGNFAGVGKIDERIVSATTEQIGKLENLLKESEREGDASMSASLKEEISGLKQTVTNSIIEQITSAKSLMQQESGIQQSEVSLLKSQSKTAIEKGSYRQAGEYERSALLMNESNLVSERRTLEALKGSAESAGDTGEVAALIEELNKNTEGLEENRLALQNNTAATVELMIKSIEAQGTFQKGIYSSLGQGIETIGKITGSTNISALKSATEGEGKVLASERGQLEGQAGEVGLGRIAGMNSQEILTWFASSEGQQTIKGLESASHTEKEKEAMRNLVDQLETNADATLQNTEKLAELNGHLNQPQSWSTTSWEAYRGAFFNGMGNLLPQYSSALPTALQPQNMPVYGSANPGISSPTVIENLNIPHPVEVADPQLFSEELSHQISTTPAAS